MALFGGKSRRQERKQEPAAVPHKEQSRRLHQKTTAATSTPELSRTHDQPSRRLLDKSRPYQVTHVSPSPQNSRPSRDLPNAPEQRVYQAPQHSSRPGASAIDVSNTATYQSAPLQMINSKNVTSQSQPHLPLTACWPQHPPNAGRLNQGAALADRIQDQMSVIITALDGNDDSSQLMLNEDFLPELSNPRGSGNENHRRKHSAPIKQVISKNYFSKVWLYANSRLPPHLPPFKVYIATYQILSLAARSSLTAYEGRLFKDSLQGSSSSMTPIHIPPSVRLGTKAMLLAVHALDTSNTIVLAIRGSATFADWAVNFRPSPESPGGFLDDPGNLIHSGFLSVAKAMIVPIAGRLRGIFQDNPDRWQRSASLLLTGHSAGGAVASLLFCHILSQAAAVKSELKDLAGLFRRVHCITFGAPPISLLPLQKPTDATSGNQSREERQWKKSLFFAFVNEGDPVVRADRAFVRSLLALYTSPAPAIPKQSAVAGAVTPQRPVWNVPPNNMSNAGRLVVLRPKPKGRLKKRTRFFGVGAESGGDLSFADSGKDEKIEAVITTDAQLRSVVFGDPAVHSMKLYAKRIETLAVNAVTGYGD